MNLLILGDGGREHALAHTLKQSPLVQTVYVAPGNEGMKLESGVELLALPTDLSDEELSEYIIRLVKDYHIQLTVVGSESFLAQSVVDAFEEEGLKIVGPTRRASQIELSKEFAKSLMAVASIPTPSFSLLNDFKMAQEFVGTHPFEKRGIVLKATGLAQGKGVFVCSTREEAKVAIEYLQDGELFPVLAEEMIFGKELSYFALCDGKEFRTLGVACDYKQLETGGKGPNTGGMGAYSPVSFASPELIEGIEQKIVKPLLLAMKNQGLPFSGFLFVGLMVTDKGPFVLEFNARLGDPEAQVILPLLNEDIFPWLMAVGEHHLYEMPKRPLKLRPLSAVHVVLAAEGYPENKRKNRFVKKGVPLSKNYSRGERHQLFYAGVRSNAFSQLETAGGRVLGVTCMGRDLREARREAYDRIQEVTFPGAQMREDIGLE